MSFSGNKTFEISRIVSFLQCVMYKLTDQVVIFWQSLPKVKVSLLMISICETNKKTKTKKPKKPKKQQQKNEAE